MLLALVIFLKLLSKKTNRSIDMVRTPSTEIVATTINVHSSHENRFQFRTCCTHMYHRSNTSMHAHVLYIVNTLSLPDTICRDDVGVYMHTQVNGHKARVEDIQSAMHVFVFPSMCVYQPCLLLVHKNM